jgi:hypothetical protein
MVTIKIVQFFQKYWKWIAIIALVIIALLSIKSCNEFKSKAINAEKAKHFTDSLSDSKVKYWQDENKQLHATVDNLFVDHFALQFEMDSVAELLKIKPKQIIAYSKTGSVIKLDVKTIVDTVEKYIILGKDTIETKQEYFLNWKDQWMQVNGVLDGINDSLHIRGTDTLTRVDYWKRKWFLGAKTYYTDITNSNPYIEVKSYKGVQFKNAVKRFNLSLSAMYGYPVQGIDLKHPSLYLGLSVGYSILKF